MAASFTESMANSILQEEYSSARFEKFCCDLFSDIDTCKYVPTSWNYDQGRDGRTSDLKSNEHPPVVCVSLRKDALVKAQEDAETLSKKKYKPKVIRFCVIKDEHLGATEHLLDKCKDIFYSRVEGVEHVIADGVIQLASLCTQHTSSFEKYYLAELENIRNALAFDAGTEQIHITGMRIALTTQFSEDANELREDLQKNLILSALSNGNYAIGMICKLVSDSLKLNQVVNPDYLIPSLDRLEHSGLINKSDGKYQITSLGIEELRKRTDDGASNLINGQQLIRELILELTGETINPKEFASLWRLVQDEIANMFMANGIYILQSIESIISNGSKVADHQNLHDSIVNLSGKVARLPIWGNKQQEFKQAFIDMFHESDSQAFKWLASLGTIYVSLCTLGLESSAQRQMEASLRNIDLLLDTDIILSFLSSGEPRHEAICSIVNTWQRINGHIYVTPCVLEETAYHAWISQWEYDDIWRDLGKYNDREANSLITNAFVRGFRSEVKRQSQYEPKYWNYYIKCFRGQKEYDYSKIESFLRDSYVFKTSDKDTDESFAENFTKKLVEARKATSDNEEIDDQLLDKFRRDGLLISTLRHLRNNKTSRSALVVSSSTALCDVCKAFKGELGSLEPVAPIGAVAYLLTMVPGANMNLGALKGLLFDPGYAQKVSGVDRIALRMIQASEEYFMPFSRRVTLRRCLNDKICETATQLGQKPEEVAKEFEHGKLNTESMTHIVGSAIDALVESRTGKKIQEQEREIRKLKERK